MDARNHDGVAIVTGGARGIGAACAERLVSDGFRVVIADVLDADGEALAARLGNGRYVHLDVVDEAQWGDMVADVEASLGPVNVLVNNAGIVHNQPLEELSADDYRKVIDINQVGVFLGMRAVAPSMRRAGHGSIINISSVAGIIAFPNVLGYVASKWAVRGMSKAAAQELGKDNIRVNSVHPGIIETPMTVGTGSFEQTAHQPLAHPGEPGDIAAAVAFLAADESKYMTGTELVVDGGFTSQ
ncbi:glucose 1-dehydrogenase [Microbacterium sp. A196]|uniref:glucose 1-dehydrogenase n=1 Tax=unclassified Microbacterium TaxID=2609290 RepID=UPI003FD08D07